MIVIEDARSGRLIRRRRRACTGRDADPRRRWRHRLPKLTSCRVRATISFPEGSGRSAPSSVSWSGLVGLPGDGHPEREVWREGSREGPAEALAGGAAPEAPPERRSRRKAEAATVDWRRSLRASGQESGRPHVGKSSGCPWRSLPVRAVGMGQVGPAITAWWTRPPALTGSHPLPKDRDGLGRRRSTHARWPADGPTAYRRSRRRANAVPWRYRR